MVGQARRGGAGHGLARQVKAGKARRGLVGHGMARRGRSRQARLGMAGQGAAWYGKARQVKAGKAGLVESRWGMAGNGRHIKETTMLIAKIAIVVMCLFSALCWIVTDSALRSK